jgi:hypothetical protein
MLNNKNTDKKNHYHYPRLCYKDYSKQAATSYLMNQFVRPEKEGTKLGPAASPGQNAWEAILGYGRIALSGDYPSLRLQ